MLQGILIFQTANEHSHSEGMFPFLYRGYGEFVKVALVGDVPFMNPILSRYDGKPVALEGEFDLNGTFEATSVTLLETVELLPPPEESTGDALSLILPAPDTASSDAE